MQKISDDGKWLWKGTEWIPNEEPQAPVAAAPMPVPAMTIPAAASPGASAPMEPMAQNHMSAGGVWAIQTADHGLFFTKLIAFFIKAFTIGFAMPWGACMVINKWCNNVRIDGRAIKFTGTPMGLFGIWMKVCALSIVTLTLYYWIAGKKQVAKYIDGHLEWA